MRAMPLMLMMFVMFRAIGRTFASLYIVLQAKDFLVMMMGQYRCSQHHHADYH
ncbi:MAG: hypothetical protein IJY59_10390 [Bacteroidaceae bacterium]|nr:hypothetical protein [Bacteroidaceae bacterium]